MLTRDSSPTARRSYSSSEGGSTPSPCLSPSTMKPSFPLRRKFHLHFLHFRISSLLRLFKSLSISCRHALHTIMSKKPKKRCPPSKPRVGTAFSAQCTRSACAPDAIADCIEFIKRSASSSSSSSQPNSPSLPSPSSPSHSSPSSLSLSSRFLSPSSQRAPSSRSHHAHYPSSQLHSHHANSPLHHTISLSSQNPLSHAYNDNSPL